MTRLILVGLATSLVVLATIITLIRTRRLQERFALVWIVAATGIVTLGLWNGALTWLADLAGISYPPSALFLLASVFVLAVLLQSAVVISRLSSQSQNLAQQVALLDERLRELEQRELERDAALADDGVDESAEALLDERIVPRRSRSRPR